jgi:hypothetical protein
MLGKYWYHFRLFIILILLVGIAVGIELIERPKDIQEEMAAFSVGETWDVGTLGNNSFYRTNILTEEAPLYARNKSVSQGLYDYASNTTYITYAGGTRNDGYSAMDPFVVAYHHSTETWEGPVRIATTGSPPDNHHYPQIVIDKQGYLHVFHTFHEPHNIIYAKSKYPRSISSWNVKTIPNSTNNTYGGAFVDNQGEIYIFFRYGYYDSFNNSPWTNKMYEPEVYMKSSDGGSTWKGPIIVVDPGRPSEFNSDVTDIINDSGFNTVYTQDFEQDIQKNGVHFTFAVHKRGKPEYLGTQRYIFFDFDNDTVYDVRGVNFGKSIDNPEYGVGGCCAIYRFEPGSGWAERVEDLEKYGNQLGQQIVFEDSSSHYPTIYYTHPKDTGENRLFKAKWNGSSWNYSEMTNTLGEPAQMFDAEYRPGEGTYLYIKTKYGGTPPDYVDYQYPLRVFSSASGWKNIRLFEDYPDGYDPTWDHKYWEVRGVSHFNLIPHAHPSIRATLIVPKYTATIQNTQDAGAFDKTWPIGAHYILGERDLSKYPGPTPIPLPTSTPTNSPTPKPTATNTPRPTATNTPKPTGTKVPTNTPIPLASDLNNDGHVNIADYTILIQNFGNTNCGNIADINGDCKVNVFDYNLLLIDYGK